MSTDLRAYIAQLRDEAGADRAAPVLARIVEQDRACLVAPEELRQWRDRAEAAEALLRAVVEALKRAPRIETVQVVEEFLSWKSECSMFVRSEDVVAALRVAEGPLTTA